MEKINLIFGKDLLENKREELKELPHLSSIVLLGYGGSIAYGTNTVDSDIDIRGIAMNSPEEILTGRDFEQVILSGSDTTIYSFNKIIKLLSTCNPNIIEMLGTQPEHHITNEIGDLLFENYHLFLSKECIHTFGGYATSQLRRLQNMTVDSIEQEQREQHILESIEKAKYALNENIAINPDEISLYVDNSIKVDYNKEVFIDWNINHLPLRDFRRTIDALTSVINSYEKVGRRNTRAIEHNKIGKHMMHLVRLYLMCIDILKAEHIITYRYRGYDQKLLHDLRFGKYLENGLPTKEFYDIVDELKIKTDEAYNKSELPDKPDMDKIYKFQAEMNEKVIKEFME